MKKGEVGGQAVIEGVMMRGSKGMAISVRKDEDIETTVLEVIPVTKKYSILNIPFLRGTIALLDSMIYGIKSLMHSANIFDETEPSQLEDWLREKFGEKFNDFIMGFTLILSLTMSLVIFLVIPTGLASIFKGFGISSISLNLIEAIIRIFVLLGYMYVIGLSEDMYRLFQYHGAEHKTIFCYEANEELTVENVKKHSRFHPRCGTNFIFLIMMVSVFLFAFTGWGTFIQRVGLRIILIPIVSGISYEVIKWLGIENNKLAEVIKKPGLKLQILTTREPDDSQIEVAIEALLKAEGLPEVEKMISELLNKGTEKLLSKGIDTARLDATLLLGHVIKKDRLYIMMHSDERVSIEDKNEYFRLIKERENKKPVSYILGKVEFMGLDFNVEEGVLIPRGDTEVLVEEALKNIDEESQIKVCDLCSGSGAIGISLANYRKNIEVDLIDKFDIPEKVTKENIIKNNVEDRATFIKSDLLSEVIKLKKKYDMLVSNPPYIKEEVIGTLMEDVKDYEPHTALNGGLSGLDFYVEIVRQSKMVLKNNGILLFEIGHDQGEDVKKLMEENDYKDVKIIKDLASHNRVVIGSYVIEKL